MYLGHGLFFEYVLKIPMGFYNIPIVVSFLVALLVACVQNRTIKLDEKLDIMAKGLADKNIVTMILIFMTAGVLFLVLLAEAVPKALRIFCFPSFLHNIRFWYSLL